MNFEPRPLNAGMANSATDASALPAGSPLHFDSEVFLSYWRTVVKWRWVVLGTILSAIVIAILFTVLSTPIYRGTSTIEISRASSKVLDIQGVDQSNFALDQEFYQTQYGLLESRSLAERVVRSLGLARNDAFLDGSDAEESNTAAARRQQGSAREAEAVGKVMKNLTVEPVRGSSLVLIHYNDPDPQLAARISNAVGENFIQSTLDRRFQASSYARKFLEGRLEQVRQRLEESERRLVAYAGQQGIITVASGNSGGTPSAASTTDQSIVTADLTALNAELAKATGDRILAEGRVAAARNDPLSQSQVLSNPTVSELLRARATLQAQYTKDSVTFQPDYPAMISLRQQINELTRQIDRTARSLTQSVSTDYESAQTRERLLRQRVSSLKSSVLDLRSRSIQYAIFQRDVDTNRALYDGLLQRYKEIGVAGGIGTNNISLVDAAETPTSPYRPRPMFNLLIALASGLVLGIGLALALEQLDGSVSHPQEFEQKIGIPLLGSIPVSERPVAEELADRKSPMSEAYYSMQTNLQFTTNHGAPRTLLVTSSRASEGKSTTALSIARNFARLGYKTILIDADMRKPSVHRNFSLENKAGLSNLLSNDCEAKQVLRDSGYDNLQIVTSGPLPPSPAELLYGNHMAEILAELGKYADHLVVDGPPVLGLADAPLLSSAVEGTVFVLESGETRAAVARLALRRLQDANAPVVGGALTKFNAKKAGYGYGYGYEQAYNYGGTSSLKSDS